ncbi:hypothetical protein MPSEU_000202900 [Mayamaea pseudoterrestris]|nr:hypothetical protein MPSEU_000202900 [Mayamaea pseudoterrestris]
MVSSKANNITRKFVFERRFSTSATSNNNVIARTLYRQLLKWCRAIAPTGVPLDAYIPPVHLRSSDEDGMHHVIQKLSGHLPIYTVEDRNAMDRAKALLPTKTLYTSTSITIPIHNAYDLSNVLRAVFRLTSTADSSSSLNDDATIQKSIAAGFETFKSLNELTEALAELQRERESHMDRSDVTFHVGQVVRHLKDRWRGVIIGWKRVDPSREQAVSLKTSLTNKDYTDVMHGIQFDILMDEGDAHVLTLLEERRSAVASELELVEDDALVRIRHDDVSDYFDRFDPSTQSFVPNRQLAYEYPADVAFENDVSNDLTENQNVAAVSRNIVDGIQEFATRLERFILDETSCPADRGYTILSNVQSRLAAIAAGDVFPDMSHKFATTDPSPLLVASLHVKALFTLSHEIQDVLSRRRQSRECRSAFHYQIGDIVIHQKYGFRGVVIACDPKPSVDVTRWDGLAHIDNPMELPFYHVIPDQGDCIEAFGGERSLRYVCEQNLMACPNDRLQNLNVDLSHGWTKSVSGKSYVAPADHRFKHGQDLDDDGITERSMERLEAEINTWHVNAKSESSSDPIYAKLSISSLLALLQVVDSAASAAPVQELIKEMRKAHPNLQLRWKLQQGMEHLLSGDIAQALDDFQQIVAADSSYAEAHNKVATCLFMMGRLEESLATSHRALALDPNHFQVLNGLGLIHFERGDFEQAVACFRKSISNDPWSPVSAKLGVAADRCD